MRRFFLLALVCLGASGDIVTCPCDPNRPETLASRQCSLCREALKDPAGPYVFFLKDINPTKPNRWLALPRSHEHSVDEMSADERTALWTAALRKAETLFPGAWAVALNSEHFRTQCHSHLHIGKLLDGVETEDVLTVASPAQIPLPKGEGLWVHPQGKGYHVHYGEHITETVLLR